MHDALCERHRPRVCRQEQLGLDDDGGIGGRDALRSLLLLLLMAAFRHACIPRAQGQSQERSNNRPLKARPRARLDSESSSVQHPRKRIKA